MRAKVGDWLVVEGRTLDAHRRQGMVVGTAHQDGSPPFRVRWVEDDHESLFVPGPEARIEPHPVPPSRGTGPASPPASAARPPAGGGPSTAGTRSVYDDAGVRIGSAAPDGTVTDHAGVRIGACTPAGVVRDASGVRIGSVHPGGARRRA